MSANILKFHTIQVEKQTYTYTQTSFQHIFGINAHLWNKYLPAVNRLWTSITMTAASLMEKLRSYKRFFETMTDRKIKANYECVELLSLLSMQWCLICKNYFKRIPEMCIFFISYHRLKCIINCVQIYGIIK